MPNGKMVISRFAGQPPRPLFGIEALALQGLKFGMLSDEAAVKAKFKPSFGDRFFLNAAGNAYSVPQTPLAVLVATMIFNLPENLKEVEERHRAAKRLRQA